MIHLPRMKTVGNNDGFVLVTALIIMVVLILFGTFALNTTNVEIQIAGNDRVAKEDFTNQEGCVTSGKFQVGAWLTDAYIQATSSNPVSAYFPQVGADVNGNGTLDTVESECWFPPLPALAPPALQPVLRGSYRIRNIDDTGTLIVGWSDIDDFGGSSAAAAHPANQFPAMAHIDKPDTLTEDQLMSGESGDGQSTVIYRRYLVTSYSQETGRRAIVQQGVFKRFSSGE